MISILLIEENRQLHQKVKAILNSITLKFYIVSAYDNRTSIQYALSLDFDIIILSTSSYSTTRHNLFLQLRALPSYHLTPIIYLENDNRAILNHRYMGPYASLKVETQLSQLKPLIIHLAHHLTEEPDKQKLVLKYKNEYHQVLMDSIIVVEYYQRRIKIHTLDKTINYKHMALKHFMNCLPYSFIQIHQSFVINTHYISKLEISQSLLRLNFFEEALPIGRSYKDNMLSFLATNNNFKSFISST